ncbi:RNA polymerase sigma factor [Chitinophaga silvatica]|uniref:RNA polymerase sigma factor n=1 Tax=Chitinophaga silvatica TaxID=2282649 RepID=A0A3E1YGT4_9BACT|nr:RNA polymerase sigma factor [Chitinophaga silvatica]RFS26633.1 RNA polymerase sigma factor [Chitinophaga silvatica]
MILEELHIWNAYREGDQNALATIYTNYFDLLMEYGIRLTGDVEVVSDALHDLFLKLWANRSAQGEVAQIKAYLLVSLRHIIFNLLKKQKKTQNHSPEDFENFELQFQWPDNDADLYKEHREKLMMALNQLPARQKEIIYLRYVQEMEYADIATAMDITLNSSYKLVHKAIESLKDIIQVSGPVIPLMLNTLLPAFKKI